MFKPLVRSLPSLSGNISLSCIIEKSFIDKINNNEYIASVKNAELIPLQNSLYNKRIPVSLLTDRWEYNVSTFYNAYQSVFYTNEYSLMTNNVEDYKYIDICSYDQIGDRNKDYEYGCKRVRYLINGTQLSFYAPIYIDNVNSLPDYFIIRININNRYNKYIKVRIAKNAIYNYLGTYLKRYLEQIDDNVIFCLPYTAQATYYGISCQHGGFEQVKDNEFGKLYLHHTTINEFDYTICNGFSRNKLMIRQIIPLAFRFNINDILTETEMNYFKFYKVKISGYYENDYVKYDLYDFDIDYSKSYPIHRLYNPNTGNFIDDAQFNVMDVNYPSLKEMNLYEYRYSNKISPHYCKWKLKHSSDASPYIINMSYGYSYLNYPELKYGEFPTMFKDIHPQAKIIAHDLKLPYGKYKDKYYVIEKFEDNTVYKNFININKYNKLIRNSYSSWFNIYDENLLFSSDNWVQVKDNEAYFKGVFYDLSQISKIYNIDNFAIFVNPICTYKEDNNSIYKSKFAVVNDEDDETVEVRNIIYHHNENAEMFALGSKTSLTSYVKENVYFVKDPNGTFIRYKNYNDNNTYYKVNDLLSNGYVKKENIDGITYDNYNIISHELINVRNNNNIFEDYYDSDIDDFRSQIIYREIFTEDITNKYNGIKERLYVSNIFSSDKKKLKSVFDKFSNNEDVYGKYALYLEDVFIFKNDIDKVFDNDKDNLSKCQPYEYVPYNNENGIILKDYFIKKRKINPENEIHKNDLATYLNNFIFVDPYNLEKYVDLVYKNVDGTNRKANEIKSHIKNVARYEYYCKFIDKNHIKEYYYKLKENNNDNILSLLYNRKRIFKIQLADQSHLNDDIIIKDSYISLDKLIKFYDPDSKNKINIETFIDSLSNNRIVNNKFKLHIYNSPNKDNNNDVNEIDMYLDLCFKKSFILLDKYIYDNIIKYVSEEEKDQELLNVYNYLYLYKLEDTGDENYDILFKYDADDTKISSIYKSLLENNFEFKDTDNYMVPLFNNIYMNDEDRELEYNILLNNVSPCKITTTNRVYYSLNNTLDCFYEINDDMKDIDNIDIINNLETERYSMYNILNPEINDNNTLSDLEQIFSVNDNEENKRLYYLSLMKFAKHENYYISNKENIEAYETYVNENLHKYLEYLKDSEDFNVFYSMLSRADKYLIYKDPDTKINIYDYNGKIYGAYVIDINLDNTNMSFYTTNDDKLNFDYFKSINNHIFNIDRNDIQELVNEYNKLNKIVNGNNTYIDLKSYVSALKHKIDNINNESYIINSNRKIEVDELINEYNKLSSIVGKYNKINYSENISISKELKNNIREFTTKINNLTNASVNLTIILKEYFKKLYPFVKYDLFSYLVKELENIIILPSEFNLKLTKYPVKYTDIIKNNESDNANLGNKLIVKSNTINNINNIADKITVKYNNTLTKNNKVTLGNVADDLIQLYNDIEDNKIYISLTEYKEFTTDIKKIVKINNYLDIDKLINKYKNIKNISEIYVKTLNDLDSGKSLSEYYTLISKSDEKNIKLIRYFNRIVPYIKKVSKINDFMLVKLKDTHDYFDNNITYVRDIYMNEYHPLRIYSEKNKYREHIQFEYKHFNDNLFYNLEEKFILKTNRIFTDNEIKKYRELEAEVSDDIYSPYYLFDQYVKNIIYKTTNYNVKAMFDENEMLFLFNNYRIQYIIKFDSLINDINYYTLNYEFTLL